MRTGSAGFVLWAHVAIEECCVLGVKFWVERFPLDVTWTCRKGLISMKVVIRKIVKSISDVFMLYPQN